MTKEEIYQTWAPPDSTWSRWVKPVVFAHLPDSIPAQPPAHVHELPDWPWVSAADGTTAIVVDLPGAGSVLVGLLLAQRGYQPVPLFNSVPAPGSAGIDAPGSGVIVDMNMVITLLITGAERLKQQLPRREAPPAFLLDARRRAKDVRFAPNEFDNRSVSLPTDFPSANFLLAAGVKQVLVIQAQPGQPETDLAHTLRRWQEAGIGMSLYSTTTPAPPAALTIERPPRFRHLWYGLLARMGLRRNPLGGYGGFIPEPSSSGG